MYLNEIDDNKMKMKKKTSIITNTLNAFKSF